MKKIELDPETINRIAEDLEMGMEVYISKDGEEVLVLLSEEMAWEAGEDAWAAERRKIKKKPENYIKIKPMPSFFAFKAMESFAYTIDDERTRESLFEILDQRKPFRHFKAFVEPRGDLSEAWYAHRRKENERWVLGHLPIDEEE